MPILDGLETVSRLKEKFKILNKKLKNKYPLRLGIEIIRPMIIHLTQFESGVTALIKDQEKADLFMTKPAPH